MNTTTTGKKRRIAAALGATAAALTLSVAHADVAHAGQSAGKPNVICTGSGSCS